MTHDRLDELEAWAIAGKWVVARELIAALRRAEAVCEALQKSWGLADPVLEAETNRALKAWRDGK
jgi:hypothetical protein